MGRDHRLLQSTTPLREIRERASYNAAEQAFSFLLQQRLLEGKDNRLELLRRFPGDPHRLG